MKSKQGFLYSNRNIIVPTLFILLILSTSIVLGDFFVDNVLNSDSNIILTPTSSQLSIQLTKHTAIEKALLTNPTATLEGNNIIITSPINKTVYNFLKDAYQNPTQGKCNIVKAYLNDTPDYANYTCIQLQNELSGVIQNGFNLYHRGVASGKINITKTIDADTNITTPVITITINADRLLGGDNFQVGDHSIVFTVVASSGNTYNVNTTTEPNNITHLLPSTTTPYNSLVAYYSFDSDKYIPNWVAGNSTSNALKFDSTNDYVVVQDSNSLDITNALTISSWVYIDATGVTHIFVSKRTGVTTNYQLWVESSDNKIYFGSNDGSWHTTNSDATLSAGRWYYLTTVYDDTANTVDFYIDGVLSVQKAFASSLTTNSAPLFVGRDGDAGSNIFGGKMDELIIWNRTLTSTEINNIYTNQTIGNFTISNRTGLVAEYNLNSTNGMIAYDSTGINNGTLANFNPIAYDFTTNNNDGTYVNQTHSSNINSIYDDYAVFDGDGDEIILSSTAGIISDTTQGYTICSWFKTNVTEYNEIVSQGQTGTSNPIFDMQVTTSGFASFRLRDSAGTLAVTTSTTFATDNNWHHLCGIRSTSSPYLLLYLDGRNEHNSTTNPNAATTWTNSRIGELLSASHDNQWWNGSIDEVMVFNSTLNSSQILQIYQNTSQRFNPTGTAIIKFQNITADGNNTINLSVSILENNYGSNVSARIGSWNITNSYNCVNESLVGYWNADGNAVDCKTGNSAAFLGTANANGVGQFNNTFMFSGVSGGVNITPPNLYSSLQFNRTGITFSAWVNGTRVGASAELISIEGAYNLYVQNTDKAAILIDGAGTDSAISTSVINDGRWHHLVGTGTASGLVSIYVDGVLQDTGQQVWYNLESLNRESAIGSHPDTTDKWAGQIDEAMIWNKSLSSNEIKELYIKGRTANVGVNWTYGNYGNITAPNTNVSLSFTPYATHLLPDFLQSSTPTTSFYTPLFGGTIRADSFFTQSGDVIKPIVNLNSPLNQTYTGVNPFFFSSNFTDETALINGTLYLWNLTNGFTINTTSITGLTNFSNLSLTFWSGNGDYKYNFLGCDSSNNCAFNNSNRTIRFDNTMGNVTLVIPTNNTFTNNNSVNFSINGTDNLGIKNLSIFFQNSSGYINQTLFTNTLDNIITDFRSIILTIADGIYTWWADIWDWAGNGFTSQNNTLTVDSNIPKTNLIAPSNNTLTILATHSFNITATDNINLKNTTFYLWNQTALVNTTTSTISGISASVNLTVTLPHQGTFYWNTYTCDTTSNCAFNNTNNTIVYDSVSPQFSSLTEYPTDSATYIQGQFYEFNVTIVEAQSSVNTAIIEFNGVNYSSATNQVLNRGSGVYTFNITNLGAGTYNYYWLANDSAGNTNLTATQTYTISQFGGDGQTHINNSRSNLGLEVGASINLNFSLITGQFGGSYLNLTENGVQIAWNQTNNISINRAFNTLGNFIINGSYSGNTNYTGDYEIWNITVSDSIIPTASYVYATENSSVTINRSFIHINITASDVLLNSLIIRLYNSSTLLYTNQSLTSAFYINYTGLSDGIYFFNATINDTSNNLINLATRNVTIDTTRPTLNITSPSNQTISSTSTNSLNAINLTEYVKSNSYTYHIQGDGYSNVNVSFIPPTNLVFGDGRFNITVCANDSVDNIGCNVLWNFRVSSGGGGAYTCDIRNSASRINETHILFSMITLGSLGQPENIDLTSDCFDENNRTIPDLNISNIGTGQYKSVYNNTGSGHCFIRDIGNSCGANEISWSSYYGGLTVTTISGSSGSVGSINIDETVEAKVRDVIREELNLEDWIKRNWFVLLLLLIGIVFIIAVTKDGIIKSIKENLK